MDSFESFMYMLDHILNTDRKRHILGGVLISASLLFGGLAVTVITIKNDNEKEENKDEDE